jgi:ferredoxin
MARITVRNEGTSFEMPDGERLYEYAKEHTSILFGCGVGTCKMCMITIVKGIGNINPPMHEEWQKLRMMNATPGQRFACQVYVKKGEVEIEY